MNRNYMVIRPEPGRSEKYTVRMLSGNRIPGLLLFQEKAVNGEKMYYYDITSRQPLGRILERRNIKAGELKAVFCDLLFTLRQMERYLLDENQICLEPECIYLEPDTFRCCFCLIPGRYENFEAAFRELAQYFLNHVSHRDSEAVVLAFSVFQECQKDNFGIEDVVRCLEPFGEKTEPDPGPAVSKTEQEKLFNLPEKRTPARWMPEEKTPVKRQLEESTQGQKMSAGERNMEREEAGPEWRSRTVALLVLKISIAVLMIGLPAAVFLFWGAEGLTVFWPMLAGGEGILALILLLAVGNGHTDVERESADAKEEKDAWISELSESYAVCTTGEEEYGCAEEEEEIQTMLLSDDPMNGGGRQLIPLNGGPPIAIPYMPFLIGKNRELSDFCLDIPGVSRLHVKIEEDSGEYVITDLNSTNGTFVDGILLNANESCTLVPGSKISIAALQYRFQ